jgi:hypothetical protein
MATPRVAGRSSRACLSGRDIADLIEGKAITAFGTEFIYDGTDAGRVVDATQFLAKREPSARRDREAVTR